ncbi:hypothetical protein SGFS_065660 [Streptomyces graminofaciens]|uniref:Uncharacterized protein n=1 Tax=Streptomyces graminofaciens TaxID=68212 RepID=A0ABN5VQ69_9ACTN|nr:hypothetical protein [Streptomyces graminofaciens]BBC35272.1 hypothetical protein SGFS_065660 [Streptomyces graminofaciens]
MSETVQQLTRQQMANVRGQLEDRLMQLIGLEPGAPQPPRPACPACGADAERIDQRLEDSEFGVDETVVRMRWLPCGHRFRGVVDPDVQPERPGEETTP